MAKYSLPLQVRFPAAIRRKIKRLANETADGNQSTIIRDLVMKQLAEQEAKVPTPIR